MNLTATGASALRPRTGAVLPIWPGTAPGSQDWRWSEQLMFVEGQPVVRNVSAPTLEVFAPTGQGNGAAVIIAPGGAYTFLMVDIEGAALARALVTQGFLCLVLRYRVRGTPQDDGEMVEFLKDLDQRTRSVPWGAGRRAIVGDLADEAAKLATRDGRKAVRFVREHAAEWGVNPDRIGMVGFSAGGGVTMEAATAPDPAERPDFVAGIYTPRPETTDLPAPVPPLFLACAMDDPAVPPSEAAAIWQTWHAAGARVELHVFDSGGHGFGATSQGAPTDAWLALLLGWLARLV